MHKINATLRWRLLLFAFIFGLLLGEDIVVNVLGVGGIAEIVFHKKSPAAYLYIFYSICGRRLFDTLIFKTLQGCGKSSAAVYKTGGRIGIYRHYGRAAEQAAE